MIADFYAPERENMGLTDRLKGLTKKAEATASEHPDELRQAIQKAEGAADERTGGKYHDQIQKAGAKAEGYVENLKPEEPPPAVEQQPRKPAE